MKKKSVKSGRVFALKKGTKAKSKELREKAENIVVGCGYYFDILL